MKKDLTLFIIIVIIMIFSFSCRKKVLATDIDLSEYGWVLYEEGKYEESNSWFISSILQDSMYSDGYNGQGWSYGKIGEIDSSISSFTKGIVKANIDSSWDFQQLKLQDPPHEPEKELLAGISLAYHAKSKHNLAIEKGLEFLSMVKDSSYNVAMGSPNWFFSRNQTINSKDIIWSLSSSYFAIGNYTKSLEYINKLNIIAVDYNVSSVHGIQQLAVEITRIRTTI